MSARKNGQPKLAIGYIRVSRVNGRDKVEDGQRYHTEDMQRERILQLAAGEGAEVIHWHIDRDESGGDKERPGFQAALKAVEDGQASVVLVAKMSRFARRVVDAKEAITRLRKADGKLVMGDVQLDDSTAIGRAILGILWVVAELELERAAEQWLEVRAKAKSEGVYMRRPALGYTRDEQRRLVVDDALAPLIRRMFLARAGGASWAAMMEEWDAAGGPSLSRTGLGNMVRNRTYVGEGLEDGEPVPGAHQPLVSMEEYDEAQRDVHVRPARSGNASLLAGLLTCSGCGHPMTTGSTGPANGNLPTYRCQGHHKTAAEGQLAGKCPARMTVVQRKVDAHVSAAFLTRAATVEGFTSERGTTLAEAIADAEQLRGDQEAYMSNLALRKLPGFQAGAEAGAAALAEADEKVARLRLERQDVLHKSIVQEWPGMDTAGQQAVLAAALERATVHAAASSSKTACVSGRLTISWNDAAF